LAWRQ